MISWVSSAAHAAVHGASRESVARLVAELVRMPAPLLVATVAWTTVRVVRFRAWLRRETPRHYARAMADIRGVIDYLYGKRCKLRERHRDGKAFEEAWAEELDGFIIRFVLSTHFLLWPRRRELQKIVNDEIDRFEDGP